MPLDVLRERADRQSLMIAHIAHPKLKATLSLADQLETLIDRVEQGRSKINGSVVTRALRSTTYEVQP
jgi:hypothetical protein